MAVVEIAEVTNNGRIEQSSGKGAGAKNKGD